MRLCVPVPCFYYHMNFPDAVRRISDLGFDAIETYQWKHLDLDAVRNACEETGVELMSMCTTEFCMTDPARRDAWLDGLRETCAAANRVGAKRLITQVGAVTDAPRQAQHDSIVAALKAAKPILEDSSVTIMIEPINTLVDRPEYYLWSAPEAFDIIREVNHPLVKVIYDIYHQQIMEGNIINNITRNLDCIAHLHAASHPGHHELNTGENDYRAIFEAVDKAGYTGACGLEYEPLLPPEESLRQVKALYGKK